ncbi:hypothetical protein HDU76_010628 [Blyttiomyces sp. JEL0837]|nr:hypothetical protein HDU76_010628 [Blyttiomyces sp. JEL0837]
MLSPFSLGLSDKALHLSRLYYQNPAVEIGLGVMLMMHMIVGSQKAMERLKSFYSKSHAKKVDDAEKEKDVAKKTRSITANVKRLLASPALLALELHKWSGYILLVLMITHTAATRLVPWLYLKDPSVIDLTYASRTLDTKSRPIVGSLFHLYYWVLVTNGMYHTLHGIMKSIEILKLRSKLPMVPRLSGSTWLRIAVGCGAAAVVMIMGVGGWFEPLVIPDDKLSIWKYVESKLTMGIDIEF